MLLAIVAACYGALRLVLTLGMLRRAPRTSAQPPVSIIVAARDEADALGALLPMLLGQRYRDYEVIIVDDRSTDATPALLRDWQARDARLTAVRVDHTPEGRMPKMHALAQGIAQARGELLLLTDADCHVLPTWVAGMAAVFTPEVGAAIGYVDLQAPHATLVEQIQALDYLAMMAMAAGATRLGHPLGAAGANLAYRRAAYDQVGGFAAIPSGLVADDMALIQRVLSETDWRVAFCDDPRAFVSTAAEPTLRAALDQRRRWMAGGQQVLGQNLPLLLAGTIIGMFNGMLLAAPLFFRSRAWRRVVLLSSIARLAADGVHLGVAAARFRRGGLLRYLPLWILAQLPYSLALPLANLLGRSWSWKGRASSQ